MDSTTAKSRSREGSLKKQDAPDHGATSAAPSDRTSVRSLVQDAARVSQAEDQPNAEADLTRTSLVSQSELGTTIRHTRTSLASQALVERHDDDVLDLAQTAQNTQETSATKRQAARASDTGSATKHDRLSWQRTRTSLASKVPMHRHDDDAWEAASQQCDPLAERTSVQSGAVQEESAAQSSQTVVLENHGQHPPADDANATAKKASAASGTGAAKDEDGWAEDDWAPTRRSQASKSSSVPEGHKQQAAFLTKSLYAKYAESSDAARADDANATAKRASAGSGTAAVKDEDGWAEDDWAPTRRSQASKSSSVPEDHKQQAAFLTKSLYAKYAESSDAAQADDANATAKRASAGSGTGAAKDEDGWAEDDWAPTRRSQASKSSSVPEDHKQQAAFLTKSLYAKYAESSDAAPADDAKATAKRASAASGTGVAKDEDGWAEDDWAPTRRSQASKSSSVPEDHKQQAAFLTKSLYAKYAESLDAAPADDAKATAKRASAASGPGAVKDEDGWAEDDWAPTRRSQASKSSSVPEDHKQQAAFLTKSLYAKYAESSDAAPADDAKTTAKRASAASAMGAAKDEDAAITHQLSTSGQVADPADEASEEEVFTKEQPGLF